MLCKEEYRRYVANLPMQKFVSNVSNVNRSGPCNVLSVTKVREIPKDLEASLAASQSNHQAPRESDVEE